MSTHAGTSELNKEPMKPIEVLSRNALLPSETLDVTPSKRQQAFNLIVGASISAVTTSVIGAGAGIAVGFATQSSAAYYLTASAIVLPALVVIGLNLSNKLTELVAPESAH